LFRQRLGSRAVSFFVARLSDPGEARRVEVATPPPTYATTRRLRVIRFVNDSRPSLPHYLPFYSFPCDRADTLSNAWFPKHLFTV